MAVKDPKADPKALSQSNYHPDVTFVAGDQDATARSVRHVVLAVVPTLKAAYEKVWVLVYSKLHDADARVQSRRTAQPSSTPWK